MLYHWAMLHLQSKRDSAVLKDIQIKWKREALKPWNEHTNMLKWYRLEFILSTSSVV